MKTIINQGLLSDLVSVEKSHPKILSDIAGELKNKEISLYPFAETKKSVEKIFSTRGAPAESEKIADAINGILYAFAYSKQKASDLISQIKISISSDKEAGIAVVQFINNLIVDKSIYSSYKSTILFEESLNIYEDSRIILDIRPVFDAWDTSKISASMIINTLRITYRSGADSEVQAISFSLNNDDLDEIMHAIQRSKDKSADLRAVMGSNFGALVGDENA